MGITTGLFYRLLATRDTMRPNVEPVYLGTVPAWRFETLLAASDTVEPRGKSTALVPGHASSLATIESPDTVEGVVEQFREHVPPGTAVDVYAASTDDRLSYRCDIERREPNDDPFDANIETWTYQGKIVADESAHAYYREALLVPPEQYGRVERRTLFPDADVVADGGPVTDQEQVADTVADMLTAQEAEVYGKIPESVFTRRNGDIEYCEWDTGDDAAAYWRTYLADDLHILNATAGIDETHDMLRYDIRVEGVPFFRYDEQDAGPVIGFRSFYDKTDELRSYLTDVLHG